MPATISLRVGTYLWMDPHRCDYLLAMLKEYQGMIGEVAFFTGFTHPPVPLPSLLERAAILAEITPRFKALGLSTGINHLSTIGHLDENLENSLNEPWQHLIDLDGSVSRSCYCAADPRMADYITRSYTALAQAEPDFIWVDDDVRMESHPSAIKFACFCERCLTDFSRQTGGAWTREALAKAFNDGARDERLALRRQWLEHNRLYIAHLLAHIRAAVDTVNPAIRIGLMTGEISYSGYEFSRWMEAMAGPQGNKVMWRPGGGFYTDERPLESLAKAHSTGRQVSLLPVTVTDIQYEHENFPYQRLKKSATIFAVEVATAIGAGCTGIALNCLGYSPDPFAEFAPHLEAIQRQQPFYDYAVDLFRRTPCEGVWPSFTRDHVAALQADGEWLTSGMWGSDLHAFNEMAEIGLPMAYTREGARVTVLSGDTCLEHSREELLALLAGGVLLDAPALIRLNECGLQEYTGFAVRGTKDRDTIEEFTADPLNGTYAGWQRDCRPSFWPQPSYLLEPLSPQCRPLSRLVDFTPVDYGPVSGVFENALGGRVGVLGYFPWVSLQAQGKVVQMRALLRWLSHDQLPAYVSSYHKAALWCRRTEDGRPAMLLLNASMDAVEDLTVHLLGEWKWLARPCEFHLDAQVDDLLLTEQRDDAYSVFTLPALAPWESVLLVAE